MKLKKIIISLIIIIFIIQFGIKNICNATEEKYDDIQKMIKEDGNFESNNDKFYTNSFMQNDEKIKIYSESAILIEAKTGKILYEKDIHMRKYPASTTKILTAILALENCDLNETQVASYEAINSVKSGYTTANIQVGEEFTIGELLDVMMLRSANEAANIIAEHISGSVSEFSKLMNKKAKDIGCTESNFVNSNGAHNENHYSTAYDMAMIARYCMQNQKFRQLVVKNECRLPQTALWQEERIFKNTNSLLNQDNKYYYKYCNGIKTGFTTPAKNCLIASSNKNGFEIISVILHAESTEEGLSARYTDTINLFEYGYNNYNIEEILEEYDLIDYHESNEENDDTILGNIIQKNDDNLGSEWIKICIGISIIFIVFSYYFIRWLKKSNLKEDLYKFKLNP